MTLARHAILHRMVLPGHTCPWGLRAKEMLEEAGYGVEDRILRSREEVDAFQDKSGLPTTPQIGNERIGGRETLALPDQRAISRLTDVSA